jgi:hypothetical protein
MVNVVVKYRIFLLPVLSVMFVAGVFSFGVKHASATCSVGYRDVNYKVNLAQTFSIPISGECEFSTPRTYYNQMPSVSFVVGGKVLPLQPRLPSFYCPDWLDTVTQRGSFSYLVGPGL